MLLFPPCAAVSVVLNGVPMASYVTACESGGRVYAPVRPFVTRIADRVYAYGTELVIVRGNRVLRYETGSRLPDALSTERLPLAPIARALGAALSYDPAQRVLSIFMPDSQTAATPSPFDPSAPHAEPTTVFTPVPTSTPKPAWNGPPRPRRTPIPASDPP